MTASMSTSADRRASMRHSRSCSQRRDRIRTIVSKSMRKKTVVTEGLVQNAIVEDFHGMAGDSGWDARTK